MQLVMVGGDQGLQLSGNALQFGNGMVFLQGENGDGEASIVLNAANGIGNGNGNGSSNGIAGANGNGKKRSRND